MTTPSVEQVFVANQTDLVNELLYIEREELDDMNLWEYIENNKTYINEDGEEVDEDDDYDDIKYDEIYQWFLVNPYYKDKVKEMGCPYLEYKGQMWAGQTFGGLSWKDSCYWKVFN